MDTSQPRKFEESHLLQAAGCLPHRHCRHRHHPLTSSSAAPGKLSARRDRAQPHPEDAALRPPRRNRHEPSLCGDRRPGRSGRRSPRHHHRSSGKVLADSEANPAMENHPTRKEFVAALRGKLARRTPQRTPSAFRSSTSPLPSPAAPSASPILSPMSKPCRPRSAATVLGIALRLRRRAADRRLPPRCWTARRLQRIVDFADRIAARRSHAPASTTTPVDEIGQVAAALDKTARQLEESFAAVQTSQRQLETLLNSMQDAVIAVSADGRVQWANQPMDSLVPQRTRLNAPVVETVRDPDFLAAVQAATSTKEVKNGPRHLHRSRPHLRCHRRPSARRRRGRRPSRPHRNRARRKDPPRLHRQRLPRTPHAADFHSGIHRNPARHHFRKRQFHREFLEIIRKNASAHVAPHRRSAHPRPRRIRRERFETEPVAPLELLQRRGRKLSRDRPRPRQWNLNIVEGNVSRRCPSPRRPRSHPPGLLQSDR